MTAPADEGDFIEIGSDLENGIWSVSASLDGTTILVETNTEDVDSLPVLVNALNQILETAWAAIEQQVNQEEA